MNNVTNRIVEFFARLTNRRSKESTKAPHNMSGTFRQETIIYPKAHLHTKVTSVIVPIHYEFSEKEARTVLREHDYINVRPPRQHTIEGGE